MRTLTFLPPRIKSTLAAAMLTLSVGQAAWANTEDPADNIVFGEGSVLIHCKAPEENTLPKVVFEEAFPKWAANLKNHADAGRVLRVHFLGKLKQGFAMVVTGKDKDEASTNAGVIYAELNQILRDAIAKTGANDKTLAKSTCVSLEIGPVMLLSNTDN